MDAVVRADDRHARIVRLASGRRFCIAEFGDPDGIPVLAMHGAPACRLMFDVTDSHARSLGLRIVAFDRPGYGHSPLDYGATLQSRTEATVELVDALGLDRFAVIGVSGGGPYAVALAARLGDRISALGLVSPLGPIEELHSRHASVAAVHNDEQPRLSLGHRTFFLDMPHHSWLLRINAEIAMRSFRAAPYFFAHSFAHLLPASDRAIVAEPSVERSIIDMTLEATNPGIGGGIADLQIYSQPWNVDFAAVAAPTVVWQGLDDVIVPACAALALGKLIPGARVNRIAGAGHFWVYNQVSTVLGAVKQMALGGDAQTPSPVTVEAEPVHHGDAARVTA